MHVRCYKGIEGLNELKRQWQPLFASCLNTAFYNDWRWHYAISRFLIRSTIYYFAIYEQEGASVPIAILPLTVDIRKKYGLPLYCLCFPYHVEIDNSDILVHKDKSTFNLINPVLEYIKHRRLFRWDVLEFSRFTDRSNTKAVLGKEVLSAMEQSAFVQKSNEKADFLKILSKKQIKNARRQTKNAENRYGRLLFTENSEPSKITEAYQNFLDVEKAGWKGEKGCQSAISFRSEVKAFYECVLNIFAESGEAVINAIITGDNVLAGQIGLKTQNSLYLLKIGYNEEFGDVGPGNILLHECLKNESDKTTQEVNLITNPPWSYRWHFDVEDRWFFRQFNNSIYGRFLKMADHIRILLKGFSRIERDAN